MRLVVYTDKTRVGIRLFRAFPSIAVTTEESET